MPSAARPTSATRRIVAVVRRETREVLRDPVYLVLTVVVPLVVTSMLALGFVLDVRHLPLAFHDQDRSPLSRDYQYAFTNSEYFRLVTIASSPAEIDRLLAMPPRELRRAAAKVSAWTAEQQVAHVTLANELVIRNLHSLIKGSGMFVVDGGEAPEQALAVLAAGGEPVNRVA